MVPGAYDALRQQAANDADLTLRALGIQLLINLLVSIIILICISWLRPRHKLVCVSRSATFTSTKGLIHENTQTWFDWIKHVARVSDDFLIDRIGYDAVLFLRFLRTLRVLLVFMVMIAVGILMPINVAATRFTGDWPPMSFDIGFLSISGIDYVAGQLAANPDNRWYWSPVAATYLFSFAIVYRLHRASLDYLAMRKQFLESPAYHLSSRSLLITDLPATVRTNLDFKVWLEKTNAVRYPVQQFWLGQQNPLLTKLVHEYRQSVYRLENTIASFLSKENKKRPTLRIRKSFARFEKVDAIEYYTKRSSELYKTIQRIQRKQSGIERDYGWVTFDHIRWARETARALEKPVRRLNAKVHMAPPANDILWCNMPMDRKMRRLKRWFGTGVFWSFLILWLIPVILLAATSNLEDLIRLTPGSRDQIRKYWFIIGLFQAYIAPAVFAILFFVLPSFFRRLAQKMGYRTRTVRDAKALTMLYIFFLVNHLLMFTLSSAFIAIYGQLRQLVLMGILSDAHISEYVAQLAKNISDLSSFWINVVCVKAFGVSMEIAQILPVVSLAIRSVFTRLSPRRVKAISSQPPHFDFVQSYNIVLFFFTIALAYSSTSPLILPFALIYFSVVSFVYKYMLMYIYVTKTESGGQVWPILFRSIMVSTIVFQLVTFALLYLKGGVPQAYVVLPLPVLTLGHLILYSRYLKFLEYVSADDDDDGELLSGALLLAQQYRDPALSAAHLIMPIIHDDVKHLLSRVYPGYVQQQQHAIDPSPSCTTEAAEYNDPPPPINPSYYDQHITLYNPRDNRSIVLRAVTDAYFRGPEQDENDHCPYCCPYIGTDDDLPEPSAPPIEQLTEDSDGVKQLSTIRKQHTMLPSIIPPPEQPSCRIQARHGQAPPLPLDVAVPPPPYEPSSSSTERHRRHSAPDTF